MSDEQNEKVERGSLFGPNMTYDEFLAQKKAEEEKRKREIAEAASRGAHGAYPTEDQLKRS